MDVSCVIGMSDDMASPRHQKISRSHNHASTVNMTDIAILPCINKLPHDEKICREPNLVWIMCHMKMQRLRGKETCRCTVILSINLFHVTIEKWAKRMFRKL